MSTNISRFISFRISLILFYLWVCKKKNIRWMYCMNREDCYDKNKKWWLIISGFVDITRFGSASRMCSEILEWAIPFHQMVLTPWLKKKCWDRKALLFWIYHVTVWSIQKKAYVIVHLLSVCVLFAYCL